MTEEIRLKDDWMIRKCPTYDEEYSDCTSIRARLHQLFIFGNTLDCSEWKRSSINCYKWIKDQDKAAGEELVAIEKERRKRRLSGHYANNTWTRRKGPPENWNCPLPEEMQKQYENTYLHVKSKELKGEISPSFESNFRFCSIM
ncbi:UPF0545 protein C22orf39 homolog [Dendroctonus ponderosae]|uniref:Synaptic plasticity regulator PANTS n=1 Tax=Dendroctonus ponderosae TaxID=77166 RepID=U4UJA7_DENPD|nr:UPF0545 protein C22orf39 homolog [Dendroctonus ponderosae]ERL92528.1 hypothetical protein D910_09841 [Dendroctonus ponderosae]